MKLFSIYRLGPTGQHIGFLLILADDVESAFAVAKEHDKKWSRDFRYSLEEYNDCKKPGVLYDVAPIE